MQITGGTHKGRTIAIPKIPEIRPTKDIVKQAVFNMLGENAKKARVADVFAGSGSLGLEALSRGAVFCDFVDIDLRAFETIKKNLKTSDIETKGRVWKETASRFLDDRPKGYYDIIFLDPPYDLTSLAHILNLSGECLKPSGVVVLEHHYKLAVKKEYDTLVAVNQRRYGQTTVTFFAKKQ
ncbi:MAG: 16S rRNA (guanine(966)-N(2))-methyltransferase RsmD [bacterium]